LRTPDTRVIFWTPSSGGSSVKITGVSSAIRVTALIKIALDESIEAHDRLAAMKEVLNRTAEVNQPNATDVKLSVGTSASLPAYHELMERSPAYVSSGSTRKARTTVASSRAWRMRLTLRLLMKIRQTHQTMTWTSMLSHRSAHEAKTFP
jgi:hypothetical protein